VLTKLDGTAKGGIVVAIARELNCPSATSAWARRWKTCCPSTPKNSSNRCSKNDPEYMREALDLARKGRSLASPNPMVGAVLVRDGEVVGRGFHTYAGVHHAEIIALAQAGEKARGATLYSTWSPAPTRAARRPASTR
jgi:deoxycytidylate deaminase